jgi:hypothetical protein
MFKRDQRHVHRLWRSAAKCLLGVIVQALLTYVCFRQQVNPTTVALLYERLALVMTRFLWRSCVPAGALHCRCLPVATGAPSALLHSLNEASYIVTS